MGPLSVCLFCCVCVQTQMFVGGSVLSWKWCGCMSVRGEGGWGCLPNWLHGECVCVCFLSNGLSPEWRIWLAKCRRREEEEEREKRRQVFGRQNKLNMCSIHYQNIWCPLCSRSRQSATAQPLIHSSIEPVSQLPLLFLLLLSLSSSPALSG